MRWLAALLVCISVTPVALADSEDDALALTLELVNQIAQIGGLTVDDPDALAARLEMAMDRFEEEADARGAQWSMSYGVDVDASSIERHDAQGNPLPVDPDTLEEDDRMPAPDAGCDTPAIHPLSAASTADARWEVCTGIEDEGDGPYYIGFSELLYGVDGNFRRVRLGVAVTSSDASYIDAMREPATQLLYEMMDAVRADAITP